MPWEVLNMAAWPSTLPLPDSGTEEELYKPAHKMEFEANYVQTRPSATRGRRKLAIFWKILSETDYQTLETFFSANQGCVFTYTHPVTSSALNCIFSDNSLKSKVDSAGYRTDVSCPIEEV